MQEEQQKSFRRMVMEMEIGDVIKVAITKTTTQRATISVVALDLSRKYSCHVDRQSRTLEITRMS